MRRLAMLRALSVLALTSLLLLPVATVRGQSATPTGAGSTADAESLARRFFDDLLNQADSAAVDELLAPGFVFNVLATFASPPATVTGGDAFREFVAGVHSAFPDVHYAVESVIVEGNEAVARWTVAGTQLGEFQGIPATGKAFAGVNGIDVFRVEGGQIVAGWAVVDTYALLSQLGVLPAGGAVNPTVSASAGDERWFVLTTPGEPTHVVATGALAGAGIVIDLLRLNPDGSFDNEATQVFANGTLYYHGAGTFQLTLDPATCIGEGRVNGPFHITGGTGAYQDASGEGVALISLHLVFDKADGGCTQAPKQAYGIARAAGNLILP